MGRPVTAYEARVMHLDGEKLVAEAGWTRGPCNVGPFTFEDGDRFVESYYFARWWNVYEVHSRADRLRGWYCNVARPARLVGCDLYFDDLALDVLVLPTGEIMVQDEDEFDALGLDERDPEAHRQALGAVTEIRELVVGRQPPFEALCDPH